MNIKYLALTGLTTLAAPAALAQVSPPSSTAPTMNAPQSTTASPPVAQQGPSPTPAPVEAQAAPAPQPVPPTVGATVYGAGGTPVGTIKAMDAQYVTLATDKGEVRLPVTGVGPGLKGPVIGLTAEQLDAAVAQATAAQAPTAAAAKAPAKRR